MKTDDSGPEQADPERDQANPDQDQIDTVELLSRIEFGFWSAAIIAPIVIWLQGPSVSHDQFVVRTTMVVISIVGAVGFRTTAILHARSKRSQPPNMPKSSGSASNDSPSLGRDSAGNEDTKTAN